MQGESCRYGTRDRPGSGAWCNLFSGPAPTCQGPSGYAMSACTSSRFVPAVLLLAAAMPAGAETIVDLTHPFSASTVYWPTAEGFRLKVEAAGRTDRGHYYAANSFCAAEHGGTHLDAPVHFAEKGTTVDRIPLERLIAPGVVVDVSASVAKDPDYRATADDLRGWEERHGPIAPGTIVLLRTGWGARYPDAERYLGTAQRGPEATAKLHFPGLHPDAARLLVERRVAAVGIDTASIDHGPSGGFESHVVLSAAEVPAFENVANLDRLPAGGFRVIALPMKIEGGSGGPLRIVALLGSP